ncbi:hypothetical protein VDGD_21324 [Verticillium dahliae]|nr:hypothetical protein VDGD_21324 [Verticillium dahliae]
MPYYTQVTPACGLSLGQEFLQEPYQKFIFYVYGRVPYGEEEVPPSIQEPFQTVVIS